MAETDLELHKLPTIVREVASTHSSFIHNKEPDDLAASDGSSSATGVSRFVNAQTLPGAPDQANDSENHPTTITTETERVLSSQDTAPEGGYGWVIVMVCSMMFFFALGITYCWGLFQARLVADGLASASTLAFVGSLAVACISILGMPNAKLVRVIGARATAYVGVVFLGGGCVSSGWTTKNTGALFGTAGVMLGIGVAACFMVASLLPGQYFVKKRGLANGIVYAGGGIGGAVISIVLDILLDKIGPAWTFRVIGFAIWIVLLPLVALLKERTRTPARSFVDWRLFRDIKFDLLLLTGIIGTFPLFVAPFYLPMYSTSIGLSTTSGALFVAAFNLSSAIGRVGFGLMSDRFLGPINSLLTTLALSTLSMLVIWPFASSAAPLAIFVILNGMANGGFFSLMGTVVAAVFGSTRVAIAMSMIVTGWVGGYLLGAPAAGYLLEAAGGESAGLKAFHPAIFYAGSLSFGATGLVAALKLKFNPRVFARV